MKCPHCGKKHANRAKFCPTTGLSLELTVDETQPVVPHATSLPFGIIIAFGMLLLAAGVYFLWQPQIPATPTQPAQPNATSTVAQVISLPPTITNEPNVFPADPTDAPIKAATVTPFPTNTLAMLQSATPASGTPWPACPGSYASRLREDAYATVSKVPPKANNVRVDAGINSLWVGKIQPGELVKIIDGPKCVETWTWWKIQSQDTGLTGWTAEGDEDNYWLVPEN